MNSRSTNWHTGQKGKSEAKNMQQQYFTWAGDDSPTGSSS